MAYASRSKYSVPEREVHIYTYPGGTPSISEVWAPSLLPGAPGGIPGRCSICSDVGCLSRSGGGAPVPSNLQHYWGFCTVPFSQGRQLFIWLSSIIARWRSIAAFTFLCPGDSTPCFVSPETWEWGFWISYRVSSIAVCENPSLPIFPILKATCMSDYSSCTRPVCLAIVADKLKIYKKLVPASTYQIRQLPLPYTLPWNPVMRLKPVLSTLGVGYQ